MKNVSAKRSRENQNTHFTLKNQPPGKCHFLDNRKKYGTVRKATDDNVTQRRKDAICTTDN
jgi:hypothetical protein